MKKRIFVTEVLKSAPVVGEAGRSSEKRTWGDETRRKRQVNAGNKTNSGQTTPNTSWEFARRVKCGGHISPPQLHRVPSDDGLARRRVYRYGRKPREARMDACRCSPGASHALSRSFRTLTRLATSHLPVHPYKSHQPFCRFSSFHRIAFKPYNSQSIG